MVDGKKCCRTGIVSIRLFCLLSCSLSSFARHLILDSHSPQVHKPLFLFQSMHLTGRTGISALKENCAWKAVPFVFFRKQYAGICPDVPGLFFFIRKVFQVVFCMQCAQRLPAREVTPAAIQPGCVLRMLCPVPVCAPFPVFVPVREPR